MLSLQVEYATIRLSINGSNKKLTHTPTNRRFIMDSLTWFTTGEHHAYVLAGLRIGRMISLITSTHFTGLQVYNLSMSLLYSIMHSRLSLHTQPAYSFGPTTRCADIRSRTHTGFRAYSTPSIHGATSKRMEYSNRVDLQKLGRVRPARSRVGEEGTLWRRCVEGSFLS